MATVFPKTPSVNVLEDLQRGQAVVQTANGLVILRPWIRGNLRRIYVNDTCIYPFPKIGYFDVHTGWHGKPLSLRFRDALRRLADTLDWQQLAIATAEDRPQSYYDWRDAEA